MRLLNYHWSRGGEFLSDRLVKFGVTHIFSIPGSQVLPVWDALNLNRVKLVVPRSERNSAFIAEGYGRASGFPAVVMSTLGPGVANELVGIYSSKLSNSPVLFLSPYQPPYKYKRMGEVFQGLDHPLFSKRVSKKNFLVENYRELPYVLDNAFSECLKEPMGPVRVDISFPILFNRYLFKAKKPSIRVSPKPPEDGIFFIFETKNDVERHKSSLEKLGISNLVSEKNVFWPGIGGTINEFYPGFGFDSGAGFGIPFALGVKFAFPKTPLILMTDLDSLFGNLDSFVVAVKHNLTVNLISKKKEVEKVSDNLGVGFLTLKNINNLKENLLTKENLSVIIW